VANLFTPNKGDVLGWLWARFIGLIPLTLQIFSLFVYRTFPIQKFLIATNVKVMPVKLALWNIIIRPKAVIVPW